MKKKEVPQDKSSLGYANSRELCYAVDENGQYTTEKSSGWEPKTIALSNAIAEINQRVEDAKKKLENKETSPIEYYMELNKMDVGILASYVGMWKWRVKRHFKPKIFKNLSRKTLQKYADVFEVEIDELKFEK